jgi:hypothetical protein
VVLDLGVGCVRLDRLNALLGISLRLVPLAGLLAHLFCVSGQYTVMASRWNGPTCPAAKPCDRSSALICQIAWANGLGCAPKIQFRWVSRERPSSAHRSCAMAINRSDGPTFMPSFDSNPKNWASGVSAWATEAASSTAATAAKTGRNGSTVMVECGTDH